MNDSGKWLPDDVFPKNSGHQTKQDTGTSSGTTKTPQAVTKEFVYMANVVIGLHKHCQLMT